MNELKYRLRKVGGIGDDAADFIEQQAAEITALQAKLSAMEKQEPVAYSVGNTLKWYEGKGMTDAQLYTAPKALEPLTDEQIEQAVEIYGIPWARYREDKYGFQTIPILSRHDYDFARAIEATITGQQP